MDLSIIYIDNRRIMWPIIGGVIGFSIFQIILSCGLPIDIATLPIKVDNFTFTAFVTFIGAWAGGSAAFNLERKREESNKRAEQISAGNRMIFKLSPLHLTYENLLSASIDKDDIRNNPNRLIKFDSPQEGVMTEIVFNIDELNFLLDFSESIIPLVLKELNILEWNYKMLLHTVNMRARIITDLQSSVSKKQILGLTPDNQEGIEAIFPFESTRIKVYTDQLIDLVDSGFKETQNTYNKLHSTLKMLFPSQNFLPLGLKDSNVEVHDFKRSAS